MLEHLTAAELAAHIVALDVLDRPEPLPLVHPYQHAEVGP